MPQLLRTRAAGAVLTAAIVGLTLATAYIHSTLGGLLFTLNALGYLGLAALDRDRRRALRSPSSSASAGSRASRSSATRAMTIAGYLVMGPYFTLGFIAKGIEVALVALLVVDVIRVYGSPLGLVRIRARARSARSLPERFRQTA